MDTRIYVKSIIEKFDVKRPWMFNVGDRDHMKLVVLHLLARASRPLANSEITDLLKFPLHKVNRLLSALISEKPAFVSQNEDGNYQFVGNKGLLKQISPEMSDFIGALKLSDGASFEAEFQQDDYVDEIEMTATSLDSVTALSERDKSPEQQAESLLQESEKFVNDHSQASAFLAEKGNSDAIASDRDYAIGSNATTPLFYQNDLEGIMKSHKESQLSQNNQDEVVSVRLTPKEHRFLSVISDSSSHMAQHQASIQADLGKDEAEKIAQKLSSLGLINISFIESFDEQLYKSTPAAKDALDKAIIVESDHEGEYAMTPESNDVVAKTESGISLEKIVYGLISIHDQMEENELIDLVIRNHSGFNEEDVLSALDAMIDKKEITHSILNDVITYKVNLSLPTKDEIVTSSKATQPSSSAPQATHDPIQEVLPGKQEVTPKVTPEVATDTIQKLQPESVDPVKDVKKKTKGTGAASQQELAPQAKTHQEIESQPKSQEPGLIDAYHDIDKTVEMLMSLSMENDFDRHSEIQKSFESVALYIKRLEEENRKYKNFFGVFQESLKKTFS